MKYSPTGKKTAYIATPRKVAYAKRREQKQKADIPLFPELVQTAEERITENEACHYAWEKQARQKQADNWRQARREYFALPPAARRACHLYYQTSNLPKSPAYLLTIIHEWRQRGILFSTKLANLRRLRTGKKPNDALNQAPRLTVAQCFDPMTWAIKYKRETRRRREHREKEKARHEP